MCQLKAVFREVLGKNYLRLEAILVKASQPEKDP